MSLYNLGEGITIVGGFDFGVLVGAEATITNRFTDTQKTGSITFLSLDIGMKDESVHYSKNQRKRRFCRRE